MAIAKDPIVSVPIGASGGEFVPPPIQIPEAAAYLVAVQYTLTLTGAQNATTDVDIPIKSFNARYKSGSPSFLSAVLPDVEPYAQLIADRIDGDLVILQNLLFSDGAVSSKVVLIVALETVRTDEGARSRSTTLTGHRQTTNSMPKSITTRSAFYRSFSGTILVRLKLDVDVFPGDTVTVDNDTFVVDTVRYQVDRSNELMELTEVG